MLFYGLNHFSTSFIALIMHKNCKIFVFNRLLICCFMLLLFVDVTTQSSKCMADGYFGGRLSMMPKQHREFSIMGVNNIKNTINEDGFKESIVMGKMLSNFVAFETEIGRIRKFKVDIDNDSDVNQEFASTFSRFFAVNILLYVDTYSRFLPYIGGGIGFAGFELQFSDLYLKANNLFFIKKQMDKRGYVFDFIMGIDYRITNRIFISGFYNAFIPGKDNILVFEYNGKRPTSSGNPVSMDNKMQYEWPLHSAGIGMRFRF